MGRGLPPTGGRFGKGWRADDGMIFSTYRKGCSYRDSVWEVRKEGHRVEYLSPSKRAADRSKRFPQRVCLGSHEGPN